MMLFNVLVRRVHVSSMFEDEFVVIAAHGDELMGKSDGFSPLG
jgi:hypothetical protein